MSKTAFIEKMLDSGAIVKLSECFENNGPTDIPSCLYYSNGHGYVVVPMLDNSDPNVWLLNALTEAYNEHGPFIEVGFVADAFGREFNDEEEMLKTLQESTQTLEQQHRSDPAAPIEEILVASAVFGDGSHAGGVAPYSYGDDGMPVFGQTVVIEGVQGGAVTFILDSFYRYLQNFNKEG